MANQKYMLIKHNPEVQSAYLGREGGGGACIARTGTVILIGVWNKSAQMSTGLFQNAGDCNDLVETVAGYLKKNGA